MDLGGESRLRGGAGTASAGALHDKPHGDEPGARQPYERDGKSDLSSHANSGAARLELEPVALRQEENHPRGAVDIHEPSNSR